MTDIKKGLSEGEVVLSREKHGANKLPSEKKRGFFKSFLQNLSDPIIRVLIVALFLNIIFMFPNINYFEVGGIAMSILIATLVSTLSEFSSDNAFEKLKAQSENTPCRVRRDGNIIEIPTEEIVVGDIILISSGERASADMIIRQGSVTVDESALTGESAEIKKLSITDKPNRENTVLKGSLILSGVAECEITEVGQNTYYGKVATELTQSTRPSPLKHRLSALAKSISILGYIASALIALAYLFNVFFIDSHMNMAEVLLKAKDIKFVLSSLLSALTLAVSIIVVAVPEGLPMMITVVLSSNMKKMIKDSVIVRKLVGIETSGSLNILFTDKTGTLTEGKLKAKGIYDAQGNAYASLSDIARDSQYRKYLALCALYCNSASYNGKRVIGSDATDRAIMELVKGEKVNAELLDKNPFDSTKKYMSVSVKSGDGKIAFFKGAPEKLLLSSDTYLAPDGSVKELKNKEYLYKKLKELTGASYRVVALGMKISGDEALDKITFIGFVAIRDKIRREVYGAIKEVIGAGVGVVMITGDNADTATAIAKECGIISSYSKRKTVLTGEELAVMSDAQIAKILPDLAVIARALPSDKSRLVKIAQSEGLVVGMTGDGINDASSLKSADVGFAMGSGTDVAKEASDIVISDNNFASVVKAILYGRTIFESIRKFIVFQLTMNLGAVGISLIGPFIGIENPVTISQMLWINIIMDTLGALAFASEPSERAFMLQKPKSRDEKIISKPMLSKIIANGIFILLLCVWFLKSDTVSMILMRGDEKYLLSAFFCMFIFMGIFVCFTSRTSRLNLLSHIRENKSFIFIMLLISVMQMGFVYFGGDIFRAVPLKAHDLLCIIAISSSVVAFDFIRKIFANFKSYKSKRANKFLVKKKQIGGKTNVTK